MSAVAGVAQGDNQSPAPLRNPAAEGAARGGSVAGTKPERSQGQQNRARHLMKTPTPHWLAP